MSCKDVHFAHSKLARYCVIQVTIVVMVSNGVPSSSAAREPGMQLPSYWPRSNWSDVLISQLLPCQGFFFHFLLKAKDMVEWQNATALKCCHCYQWQWPVIWIAVTAKLAVFSIKKQYPTTASKLCPQTLTLFACQAKSFATSLTNLLFHFAIGKTVMKERAAGWVQ